MQFLAMRCLKIQDMKVTYQTAKVVKMQVMRLIPYKGFYY